MTPSVSEPSRNPAASAAAVAIPFSPLNGPFAFTAAIMIYIFGQMLVQPNAVAAALMPLRHMAGTGSALMGMIQMLFGALCGYAVNALYDGTPLPMTGTLLVAGLACTVLSLLLRRWCPREIRSVSH